MSSTDKEKELDWPTNIDEVWENFKKVEESEPSEEDKARYFDLVREFPIYPEVKYQQRIKGPSLEQEILISTLLRTKLNDGKYYISEIHCRESCEIEHALNKFHKFVYLNIISRNGKKNELDILDVVCQLTEVERIQKIFTNGKQ